MQKTISIRQAAIQAGISRQAIHKHLKVGRITMIDGKINLESFQSWLKNRDVQDQDIDLRKIKTPHIVDQDNLPIFQTLQDAELNKRSYEARLKELEYEQKSSEVVRVEDVATALKAQFDLIRNALKAFPLQIAPKLKQCKTVAEVQGRMQKEIVKKLDEIANDDSWMKALM